jgi:hypothetical protein
MARYLTMIEKTVRPEVSKDERAEMDVLRERNP